MVPAGWVGLAASVGMLVVLVMGATVTDTGSAQGCGRDWPLCQGRLVPEFAVSTLIEFSHRAVTGVESILIVALAGLALGLDGGRRPVQVLAPLMFLSPIAQAGLGAAAVKWPQQPAVLALHLGVPLIALASTTLLAMCVRRPGSVSAAAAASGGVRAATWGVLAYVHGLDTRAPTSDRRRRARLPRLAPVRDGAAVGADGPRGG